MKLPKNFGGQGFQGALAQAQQAMARAETIDQELALDRIEVKKEVVTVIMDGTGDLKSIKIDPEAVDPDDVESLEDILVAAVRDAFTQATTLREAKMKEIMPNIPGLDKLGL